MLLLHPKPSFSYSCDCGHAPERIPAILNNFFGVLAALVEAILVLPAECPHESRHARDKRA